MKLTVLKFAAFLILLALWIALDYVHLNDPKLIETIQYAIAGLGLWHGIANLQTVPSATPPAPAPRAPSYPTVPLE
jgi:hypothetical protein